MSKYTVIGLVSASIVVGEYEANSENEAIEKANNDPQANCNTTLCNQCSRTIDIGDVYELRADKNSTE